MARYFLEVAYRGTNYSGYQAQENAPTIQAALERALEILHREKFELTGSSRTDAGVHANQNFFHFDRTEALHPQAVYKLNAILPGDVVVKRLYEVPAEAHCRFDAVARSYAYYVYRSKDPFLADRAFYFPYTIDLDRMQAAAKMLMDYNDFTSFSKRNTQVKTFQCKIQQSEWVQHGETLIYRVRANRFLRGMVRALVSTMLLVGREKITLGEFKDIISVKDCTRASFVAPAHGLFLMEVGY